MNRPEFDNLTKLYTESYLEGCVDQELLRSQRYGRPLSMLVLGVELPEEQKRDMHYRVLKQLGGFIKMYTRSIDVGGRTKDRVMVMLPETPIDGALVVATKIKSQIENHIFVHPDTEDKFSIVLSYKIVAYPDHGPDRKALMEYLHKFAPDCPETVEEVVSGVAQPSAGTPAVAKEAVEAEPAPEVNESAKQSPPSARDKHKKHKKGR